LSSGGCSPRLACDPAGDATQPVPEPFGLSDRPGLACQHQKRGLESVLGVLLLTQYPPAHAHDQRTVSMHERRKGLLIPGARKAIEQIGVRHGVGVLERNLTSKVTEQRAERPGQSVPAFRELCALYMVLPG